PALPPGPQLDAGEPGPGGELPLLLEAAARQQLLLAGKLHAHRLPSDVAWGPSFPKGAIIAMPRTLVRDGPGRLRLADHPTRPLHPGEIRLRARLSGISHGTELTLYRRP